MTDATLSVQKGVRTWHGDIAIVTIGGVHVGIMQSVNASMDYGMQPVSGIGTPIVYEHVPGMARISITADTAYILPAKVSIGPIKALPTTIAGRAVKSLSGYGITYTKAEEVVEGRTYSIAFFAINPVTDDVSRVITFNECTYAGGSISIQRHTIVMSNSQWMATNFDNADSVTL